jgi:predicted outer membrane repeat protein
MCLSIWIVFLIFAQLVSSNSNPNCGFNISISSNGHDDPDCLNGESPCRTIDYAFTNCTIQNGTIFTIGPGTFTLSTHLGSIYNTSFSHLDDITIEGAGPMESIISCNSSITDNSSAVGFAFVNMTNLEISKLSFVHCGEMRPSTSKDKPSSTSFALFFVGVYIWRCVGVNISNVHINDTEGVGLVLYETGGKVDVSQSVFSNNAIPVHARDDPYLGNGGGGVHVDYSPCAPGNPDPACTTAEVEISCIYQFSKCTFLNNTAYGYYQLESSHMSQLGSNRQTFGRGGGLTVFAGSRLIVTIDIVTSLFVGNEATYGGGLFIEFGDYIKTGTLNVLNTHFIENIASQRGVNLRLSGGGGANIVFKYVEDGYSKISFSNVTFVCNKAYLGGGLLMVNADGKSGQNMYLTYSVWKENTAHFGSAVYLYTGNYDPSFFTVVRSCSFVKQSIEYNHQFHTHTEGYGTVYAYNCVVQFTGSNVFQSNVGSGLVINGGSAEVFDYSDVLFDSNSATYGGGIALYSSGYISLLDNSSTSLRFINNSATIAGGGIYVHSSGGILEDCPVYYYDTFQFIPSTWTYAQAHFCNNSASTIGGANIYVPSLTSCLWYDLKEPRLSDPQYVFKHPYWAAFTYCNINQSDSIGTGTTKFVLPDHQSEVHISVFPGEVDNLFSHFTPENDFNATTRGYFSVSLADGVEKTDTSVRIAPGSSYTSGPVQFSKNTSGSSSNGEVEIRTLIDPTVVIVLNVTLLNCPPGTHLSDKGVCVCSSESEEGHLVGLTCEAHEASNLTFILNSDYWFGYTCGDTPTTGSCPYAYCQGNSQDNNSIFWPIGTLSHALCSKGSSGVLCGSCLHGVLVLSNTYHCGTASECESLSPAGAWVLWISIQLIFTTLIVAFILIFDVKVLSGELCSFVFFCQIVHSLNLEYCMDCYPWPHVLSVFQALYGLWNLRIFSDLPIDICIRNLNAIELLAVEYVFAFYPFFLILSISLIFYFQERGWCCSCGHRLFVVGNRLLYKFRRFLASRTSLIHGISTCLVLTYGKLAYISLSILTPVTLNVPLHSNYTCPKTDLRRSYYHGDWVYFGSDGHVYFGLLAVAVVMIFIVFPPMFLMSYPILPRLVKKCSRKAGNYLERLYRRRAVLYLLDIFQAHYHKKAVFFAGVWFVYRLVLYINDAFNPLTSLVVAVQILSGNIFLLVHSILQPYKSKLYNVIDVLFFVTIATISMIILYSQASTVAPKAILGVVIYILLSLPYLYFTVYIGYKVVYQVCVWCKACRGGRGERVVLRREAEGEQDYESTQDSHTDGREWLRGDMVYDDDDDDVWSDRSEVEEDSDLGKVVESSLSVKPVSS